MAVGTALAIIGGVTAIGSAISDRKSAGDAVDAQAEQNAKNEAFIREQAAKAREDIIPLFQAAQGNIAAGGQAALDVFSQTIPRQLNQLTAGSFAAQNQLIKGLPQIQNAILGLPTDLSALKPIRLGPDQSFASQQLPDFATGLGGQKEPILSPAQVAAIAAAQGQPNTTPSQRAAIAAAQAGGNLDPAALASALGGFGGGFNLP